MHSSKGKLVGIGYWLGVEALFKYVINIFTSCVGTCAGVHPMASLCSSGGAKMLEPWNERKRCVSSSFRCQ